MKELMISGEFKLTAHKNPDDSDAILNRLDTIINIIKTPSDARGIDFSEMGDRVALISKIQGAKKEIKGSVLIEESEYQLLLRCMKEFRWVIADPAIFEWMKSIENLPIVKVDKVSEKSKEDAVKVLNKAKM